MSGARRQQDALQGYGMEDDVDPRAKRTRAAILGAFTALLLSRRYDAIRVADLIAAAGVGRSTFYEHFRGKDEVLLAAAEPILHTLASAALRRASKVQLRAMLEHVWEQRGVARPLLDGRAGDKLQRRVAALIVARGGAAATLPARAVAAAQLTMLRLWAHGETPCPAAELASHILASARLLQDPD